MGEVDTVIERLRARNPKASVQTLRLTAEAFVEYRTAQANISEHGTIVFHPRTGAPIENPYLKIRDRARDSVLKLGARISTDCLWTD